MKQCLQCGKILERSLGNPSRRKYCDRVCFSKSRVSTTSIWRLCYRCGSRKSKSSKDTLCQNCSSLLLKKRTNEKTLKELRDTYNISQFHAKIRGHSRSVYLQSGLPLVCAKIGCNYTLHVDICHIKAVADFSEDATLAEVNSIANLIALDKRCHWEFDHGHLTVDSVDIRQTNVVDCT